MRRRQRDVTRRLRRALRHTQKILHGTLCQEMADCVEACESARDELTPAGKPRIRAERGGGPW